MKPTNYAARAWLLKNRQRLEKAKRQAEKIQQKPVQENDRSDFHAYSFVLTALCGLMGRVMP